MARSRKAIVKAKSGILLDLSLGGVPQPNSVTCAELKMDPLKIPFPLPTASVHTAVVTHLCEFLEPQNFWKWFDELHRVMRPGGVVYMSGPYGGDDSQGWVSEPSHKIRIVEQTIAHFDPRLPFFNHHADVGRSQPKPWHVLQATRVPGVNGTTSYNFIIAAQVVEKARARVHPRRKRS